MEVNFFFSIRAPSSCSVGQAIVVNCYALKNSQPASNTYIILNSYVPHYTFSEDDSMSAMSPPYCSPRNRRMM